MSNKSSLHLKITVDQFDAIIYYVEQSVAAFVPDHEDVDLMIRMKLLQQLRVYLLKRKLELEGQPKAKITVPDIQALALLAQWKDDLTDTPKYIALSISKITSAAHLEWM